MNKTKLKTALYMESLFFLFLGLGIYNFKADTLSALITKPFIGACYVILTRNIFSMILLALAAADVFLMSVKRSRQLKEADAAEALFGPGEEPQPAYAFSFGLLVASYFLPFALVLLFGFKGKLLVLCYLFVLGYFCVNTSYYYRNPVLWLLGYRLFRLKDGEEDRERVLIAEATPSASQEMKAVRLSDDTLYGLSPESGWRFGWLFRQIAAFCGRVSDLILPLMLRVFGMAEKLLAAMKAFVSGHPALTAFAGSTLIMILMWAAGLMRWEGSDDFTVSQLLMGTAGEASPYVLVCSYFLGIFVIWLQRVAPVVNWFTALEIFSVWASFGIIAWYMLKHSKGKKAAAALLFLLIFEPLFFVNLQYTRTAILLPFAGLLLIFDTVISAPEAEEAQTQEVAGPRRGNPAVSCFKVLTGIAFFILGSMFRFLCFYIGIAYVLVLVFSYFLDCVRTRSLKKNAGRIGGFAALTLLLVLSSHLIYHWNNEIYEAWDQTTDYREYNYIRANVSDYIPSEYSDNLSTDALYVSENDYLMMKYSVINDRVFSKEYLAQVKNNLDSNRNDAVGATSYNLLQAFYLRTGRLKGVRSLIFFFMVLALLSLPIGRSKSRLAILADILGTVVFVVFFLWGNRLPSWVADPVYLLACSVVVILVSCIGEGLSDPPRGYNLRYYMFTGVLLCGLVLNASAMKTAVIKRYYDPDMTRMIQYAENSDHIYLMDNIQNAPYPYIDVYGALAVYSEGQWDNMIRVGNWDVGHPVRERQKERLGIDSVISSMAGRNTYLLSESDSATLEMYKTFFREHYGKDAVFIYVQSFGDYRIYKLLLF